MKTDCRPIDIELIHAQIVKNRSSNPNFNGKSMALARYRQEPDPSRVVTYDKEKGMLHVAKPFMPSSGTEGTEDKSDGLRGVRYGLEGALAATAIVSIVAWLSGTEIKHAYDIAAGTVGFIGVLLIRYLAPRHL